MNCLKLMIIIKKFPNITQRKLAEKLGVSLGKVNLEIKKLELEEVIIKNKGYYLTDKGILELEKLRMNKIQNAVILAAGKSRDFDFPNGFVKIDNEILVERSIKILLEVGIKKIYIIVGYKKEYYEKLSEKYSEIFLIENFDYEKYSSYYSFKMLEGKLKEDFLLLDSDILYEKKAIKKILDLEAKNVILISSESGSKDEAYVEEEKGYLVKMSKDKNELKKIDGEMLGISKISYEFFKEIIKLQVKNSYYSYEYSIADIAKIIPVSIFKINELVWGEVDNKEQYIKVSKNIYPKIKRNEELDKKEDIKKLLTSILNIKLYDIDDIEVLGGMTNKNYLITINTKKFVLRLPGYGTSNMINRYFEKINADKSSKIGVDKPLIYFDENTGIKISEYIENAETLNPETSKKVENLCLTSAVLRKLHQSNLKFENKFDVYNEIIKYENLIKNKENLYKKYEGYLEFRNRVFDLKNKLIENGYLEAPCHNDTVPENFIKNNKDEIYLIDWEYSGMNDPMWDLAAHSLESNFSLKEEKIFLDTYFGGNSKKEDFIRIEIYKILQDFLWSIWTILKEENGDEFGSYGINRYLRSKKRMGEIINEI